ncbi:hypothetical protein CBS101457_004731 [Exobasidium rhododendri]|nr:hypothetical protein CBS101457_004731 [Exobasidium rhododendri]
MLVTAFASSSRRGLSPSTLHITQPIRTRQITRSSRLPVAVSPRILPVPQQRHYSTEDDNREKAKDRAAVGPFNMKAAALFVVTGVGLFYYFSQEKKEVERKKKEESAQAKIGRPKIGGPFELVLPTPATVDTPVKDIQGRRFTADDLLGSFSFIYFGFTNCPDICPEELDKMTQVVENVERKHGPVINPVFITCDPARDSLAATAVYISEFHPRMVGLTGTYEAIKDTCKAFRVYFSTPPGAEAVGDYLVDHSIFLYVMDPEGKFVDAFGRSVNADETTEKVLGFIEKWKEAGNTIKPADAKEKVLNDQSRVVGSV